MKEKESRVLRMESGVFGVIRFPGGTLCPYSSLRPDSLRVIAKARSC